MNSLLKIAHWIDGLTEHLGSLANWMVIAVIIVGFYNPVVRFLGQYLGVTLASNVYIELQWYLFSLIFLLGFAYILKHGVNVRVDFFYSRWNERTRAQVDFWGTLLVLIPFCLIGIYVTINPVLIAWGRLPSGAWDLGAMEWSSDADGLPRAPIKTMIIVAWVTLLLQSLSQLIKYLAILRGRSDIGGAIAAEVEAGAE